MLHVVRYALRFAIAHGWYGIERATHGYLMYRSMCFLLALLFVICIIMLVVVYSMQNMQLCLLNASIERVVRLTGHNRGIDTMLNVVRYIRLMYDSVAKELFRHTPLLDVYENSCLIGETVAQTLFLALHSIENRTNID